MKSPEIIFQDEYIVAFYKEAGVAIMPDKSEDASCLSSLNSSFGQELHLLNRLDRPVSGIALVARSKKAASVFSELLLHSKIEKTYLAATENKPEEAEAKLTHLLLKKNGKSYIVHSNTRAKKAILHYKYLLSSKSYHFLEIQLLTGRFHQIRAQLGHIQCPIKGDVKYGARRGNRDRSIHLHAYSLAFIHPFTDQPMLLKASLPEDPVWQVLALTLP